MPTHITPEAWRICLENNILQEGDYFYWEGKDYQFAIIQANGYAAFQSTKTGERELWDQHWNIRLLGYKFLDKINDIYRNGVSIFNPFRIDPFRAILRKENESKLEYKCRKLWNNSNYVKKNPHLAY